MKIRLKVKIPQASAAHGLTKDRVFEVMDKPAHGTYWIESDLGAPVLLNPNEYEVVNDEDQIDG